MVHKGGGGGAPDGRRACCQLYAGPGSDAPPLRTSWRKATWRCSAQQLWSATSSCGRRRRRLAAEAGRVCNALLRTNFALQPRGRTRMAVSTMQSRLLLAYLPLEPLRPTALGRSTAEAVVDSAIGGRCRRVSAALGDAGGWFQLAR
jgi:hypothetical protein